MYEFRVRVAIGTEGGEQAYIISAESESELDAEDQIKYLVENKLEVLSISQIKIGG